jgi:putative heme-binding domain-containing protein
MFRFLSPQACLVLRFALGLLIGLPLAGALYSQEESAVGPVMKLFQSGRLPVERQGSVVEMICNRGNGSDLRVIFEKVMADDGFTPELRLKALDWLASAANTRKVKPAGDLDAINRLIHSTDSELQLSSIRAASAWRIASASKALQAIATGSGASAEVQRAAIEGLVAIGGEENKGTLLALSASGRSMHIRALAVAGLVSMDLPAASAQAAAILADAKPTDNLAGMLNAFFDRKDGADALANRLKESPLSQDVAKMALRYMYSVGRSDASLSAVLSEAAGVATDPAPPTQEEVAKMAEEVMARGDAARGELIFRRAELSCLRCHGINRAGGQIGPDLSAVGGSSPLDYIINSILNPDLAVKEQYVTKIFVLESGKVLTGVVVDRDDNRVLIRDAQGKNTTIATADIEEEAEGKSMMPQGLTKFLTHDETLDLVKFVSELGKPGPYGITKTSVVQRWRVMDQPPSELLDDVPHLEHIRQLVLSSQPEHWTSAYSMVSGRLPLSDLPVGTQSTVFILQAEVQVNEAGTLTFTVSTDAKYQLWIDDQMGEAKERFDTTLATGRHTLTIRLEVAEGRPGELKVEITKPDSSSAQFEIVGGT